MKQQTIETGLCTLLLVEIPEGIDSFMVHPTKINTLLINSDKGDVIAELPMWSVLIGRLPELTEEQAKCLIDSWDSVWKDGTKVYENYAKPIPKNRTALESFSSLLEANGTVFENPIKVHTWASENSDEYKKQWQEAQSKVWEKERVYIFKKIK